MHRLRGRPLQLALAGFVVSFAIAIGAGLALAAAGFTSAPLLVAIVLCATSLGLVVPVLKDAGQIASETGQLIVAAASIADFGAVILLSLFFSESSTGIGGKLLLLVGLAIVAVLVVIALMRAGRTMRGGRGCSGRCRTPPRRSGSASPCCCWSRSSRSRRAWGSRRSSVRSSPGRCCGWSTRTPRPCTRTPRSSSTRSATASSSRCSS